MNKKLVFISILLLVVLSLLGCKKKHALNDNITSSPAYMGSNQRTSYYPTKPVNDKEEEEKILRIIRTQAKNSKELGYKGAYLKVRNKDTLYFDDHGSFKAIDINTGKTKWSTQTYCIAEEYSIEKGIIYINRNKYLCALNATNGKELWKFKLRDEGLSPLVQDGTVFVINRQLYALNAKTGKVKWKRALVKSDYPYHYTNPAYAYGNVYVTNNERTAYAYNAKSGKEVWKYTTGHGNEYDHVTSPIIYKGRVFFGSFDNKLYAIDAISGKTAWKRFAWVVSQQIFAPSADKEQVYYLNGNTIKAYDISTGVVRWSLKINHDLSKAAKIIRKKLYYIGGDHFRIINIENGKPVYNGELSEKPKRYTLLGKVEYKDGLIGYLILGK